MIRTLILLTAVCLWQSCSAQKSNTAEIFGNAEGAIKGYDPVAYFTVSKPVKGKANITFQWSGATWHFDSEANKQLFVANPTKYAPQYGGYCAYGWAKGYEVKIEPDAWSVVKDKLYLNYDKKVQADWDKDRSGYIKTADENYQKKKAKQGNSN
jgi:YHS domain-containing protein